MFRKCSDWGQAWDSNGVSDTYPSVMYKLEGGTAKLFRLLRPPTQLNRTKINCQPGLQLHFRRETFFRFATSQDPTHFVLQGLKSEACVCYMN